MATKDKIVIFVAHAADDNPVLTVRKIRDICAEIYKDGGLLPIVPYIIAMLIGNTGMGIELSLLSLELELKMEDGSRRRFVNQVWLYGDRISKTMRTIINFAQNRNIPVIPKSEGTRRDYEAILAEKQNSLPPA